MRIILACRPGMGFRWCCCPARILLRDGHNLAPPIMALLESSCMTTDSFVWKNVSQEVPRQFLKLNMVIVVSVTVHGMPACHSLLKNSASLANRHGTGAAPRIPGMMMYLFPVPMECYGSFRSSAASSRAYASQQQAELIQQGPQFPRRAVEIENSTPAFHLPAFRVPISPFQIMPN